MKRNIKSMLVMLLGVVALAACSDNDYTELDKGSNMLALTVNQAADTLSETPMPAKPSRSLGPPATTSARAAKSITRWR